MPEPALGLLRDQLVGRRGQLVAAMERGPAPESIHALLGEVDAALERMEHGTYGLCDACHEPIEPDRLLADPLLRWCLPHLTPAQQVTLERDLELAVQIQRGLLPARPFAAGPWSMDYAYRPAQLVSGDYCDVLPGKHGEWYFLLGDVAGKGVAASMMMTQLHAMFRALVPLGLSLPQLVGRASAIFCESTLPTHYATLACLRATPEGDVEICSAGHLPPVFLHAGRATRIDAGGLPMGMFCSVEYATTTIRMAAGDALALCTDGLSESENGDGEEFGLDRLERALAASAGIPPAAIVARCVAAADSFRSGPQADDVTMMVVGRG